MIPSSRWQRSSRLVCSFLGGEAVAEVGAVADCARSIGIRLALGVSRCSTPLEPVVAVAEAARRSLAVHSGLPCGVVVVRCEEGAVEIGIARSRVDAVERIEPFPFRGGGDELSEDPRSPRAAPRLEDLQRHFLLTTALIESSENSDSLTSSGDENCANRSSTSWRAAATIRRFFLDCQRRSFRFPEPDVPVSTRGRHLFPIPADGDSPYLGSRWDHQQFLSRFRVPDAKSFVPPSSEQAAPLRILAEGDCQDFKSVPLQPGAATRRSPHPRCAHYGRLHQWRFWFHPGKTSPCEIPLRRLS